MKFRTTTKTLAVALVCCLTVVGCRKGLEKTTPLPGRAPLGVTTPETAPLIGGETTPAPPRNTADNNTTAIKPPGDGVTSAPVPTPAPTSTAVKEGAMPLNEKIGSWVASADQPIKETVYFDFDKSTIKPGEVSKVERVASGIKGLNGKGLRVEGHCDERGTEEYNRSLGERRALAVREALVRAGVDPNIVDTISYGEDRPVDPGHNDAAWSKNRRGEFIVIEPPTAAASK